MRTAARPYRTGNDDVNGDTDTGVPVVGETLLPGVVGVRGPLTLNRPLLVLADELVAMREGRRCGVAIVDDVERAREEIVRLRETDWFGLAEGGEVIVAEGSSDGLPDVTTGFASPSCHWRCMITDLVAHYKDKKSVIITSNCE